MLKSVLASSLCPSKLLRRSKTVVKLSAIHSVPQRSPLLLKSRFLSSSNMDKTTKESSTMPVGSMKVAPFAKILQLPESVRGMTELDKDKFTVEINFPVVLIDPKDLTKIRGKVRLEKYLLKNMLSLKNIMDSEVPSKKALVFDPDVVSEENSETRSEILEKIGQVLEDGKAVAWSNQKFTLKYDHWDTKRIIRAILPTELDFSSFTQTGHIIHCNFRDELIPYKKIIGEILLSKVKQARTVVNKLDGIKSEYRNFELELVAGEADYVAEVMEGGVRYKLDFSKVFWNSRLSHEHERVLKRFDSRSLVYDACAGVGPFALPAVKKVWSRRVLANDLNPDSVHWMKENCRINKISHDKLQIHNMDASEFIRGPVADDLVEEMEQCSADPELTPPSGAHIMMNLPAYAVNFLPAFRGMLAGKFSSGKVPTDCPFPVTAYCYLFAKAHEEVPDDWFEQKAKEMVEEKLEGAAALVSLAHHVRTVSSRKEMYCMQIDLPWALLTQETSKDETEPPAKKMKENE